MSKVKAFDKVTVRLVREKMDAALQAVAKEFGISIRCGSGRYTATNVSMKVELSVISDGGEVETKEMADFKRYAEFYGLKPEDLGTTFSYRGDPVKIIGAKPSCRKYPILGRNNGGKVHKYSLYDVKLGLGRPTSFADLGRSRRGQDHEGG